MADRKPGATFTSFRAASRIEDPEEKRDTMLGALDEVWELAKNRSRERDGGTFVDPDSNALIKCVQLACEMLGVEPKSSKPKPSGSGEGDSVTAITSAAARLEKARIKVA